jgi:hypothetical protein
LLDAVEDLLHKGQQSLDEGRALFGPNLGNLDLHACQCTKLARNELQLGPGLMRSYKS